ncbi:MAG: MBL fold metallo-hydrolase [Negativicutes bacterium]|jgi:7,8-dihydropterin-6-yl-methyl-4-(beta-D-ribofuranosyl)aminobenzene 5'-phosphate synthase
MIKASCLSEDYAGTLGVLAEFGLSLHIEFRAHKILFDTGQLGAFVRNAGKMNIDLAAVDACVLSHGHFDHGGGLSRFIRENSSAPVYLRAAALQKKYKRTLLGKFYIGINRRLVANPFFLQRVVIVDELVEIFPDCYLLGGFAPNSSGFEPLPSNMLGADGKQDQFSDEQVLIIRDNGLHIFAGCSHPGIVGMLEQICDVFPGESIVSVVAGMHSRNCTVERLQHTLDWFGKQEDIVVVPLHCTGFSECTQFRNILGDDRCELLHCGDILEL